jgi:hypothetical protein
MEQSKQLQSYHISSSKPEEYYRPQAENTVTTFQQIVIFAFTFSIGLSAMLSNAGPLNSPCEANAKIRLAPFLKTYLTLRKQKNTYKYRFNSTAALHNVPAMNRLEKNRRHHDCATLPESMMSSTRMQHLPSTSPSKSMRAITPGFERCFEKDANSASIPNSDFIESLFESLIRQCLIATVWKSTEIFWLVGPRRHQD